MLFANFAEAMAEGRGKAQADTLRKTRDPDPRPSGCDDRAQPRASTVSPPSAAEGRHGVRARRGRHPRRRRSLEGVASVDESAITGESAPVIRESGGDRSAVTGGTQVLSDYLIIRVTANPGETFLDRMIALVEGAARQKTPNEIALTILLSGLTIVFLLAVVDAPAIRASTAGPRSAFRCWSRCSSVSSRPRSAVCSRRSALPEWTG